LTFEQRFIDVIEKNKLLNNAEKILLAVSGGPDSLTMLHLFNNLKDYFGVGLSAAHLDHLFREESAAEADFVEDKCAEFDIEFFKKTVDVSETAEKEKLSPEAAARKERFKFFQEIYFEGDFDLLALAHHRDDQVETVLLNLFRGSGLRGLKGIEKSLEIDSMKIIHPLLDFSRKEILDYCSKKKLEPRFDSSNQENIYSRNVIRNKIIPMVEKEINPSVKEVVARNAELIAAEEDYLNREAMDKYRNSLIDSKKNIIKLDLNILKSYDEVMIRRVLRRAYKELNKSLEDIYLDNIIELEKIIEKSSTGKGIDLPSKIRAEINYDEIRFFNKSEEKIKVIEKRKKISLDGENFFGDIVIRAEKSALDRIKFTADPTRAVFDSAKINFPIFMRSRKDGDILTPLGMQGRKKLKDILIDEKIPRFKRNKIPVIVDAEDDIIWLAGLKMSDKHKVTEDTEEALILELSK